MDELTTGILFFIAFFISILLFVYLGKKLSVYQEKKYPERVTHKNRLIEGAIFALMGLLIALTFAGARERFDVRRALIIDEANSIKTAYLRLDLLPSAARINMQHNLKEYLTLRLAIYEKMPHTGEVLTELRQSKILQQHIWDASVHACIQENNSAACIVLLPALNRMIDLANTRFESTQIHPPAIILITLIGLALFSATLAGYSIPDKSTWPSLHIFLYALVISFTIFVIINLEYPHLGFIPVNYFDQVLIDVMNEM